MDLIGAGNEALPSARGSCTFEALIEHYRSHRAYLNPGPVVCVATVEAMMTGMPIVSVPPINYKDVFVHRKNAMLVETPQSAVLAIKELAGNPVLRSSLGREARRSAMERFGLKQFASKWNSVFQEVAG